MEPAPYGNRRVGVSLKANMGRAFCLHFFQSQLLAIYSLSPGEQGYEWNAVGSLEVSVYKPE